MSMDPPPFLRRLLQATNAHDLDAIVGCFGGDYRNETPAHPGRAFQGNLQVRDNWQQIFTFVPDVQASVLSWAGEEGALWSEWEMSGTRVDGSRHLMRGVIIFQVRDEQAESARFYLEPVDEKISETAGLAVRQQVHAGTAP